MKLSIFTTVKDPDRRGDTAKEALKCYYDLADEIVIVDGATGYSSGLFNKDFHKENEPKHKLLLNQWPKEFSWEFIGQQFQRGFEACTGDWVIHADLDFIFHEDDFSAIRKAMEDNPDAPALSFWKYQFIQPDRYNLKSRLVIAVNKGKYGDRIKFNSGGDLCQPSLDGKLIKPDDVPEARIPLWNYEKLLKTKEQVKDDVGRMERAYKRHFGKTQYGSDGTDDDAFNCWIEAQKGKLAKPQAKLSLDKHPKYIQETIKNLKPDQFGAGGWGLLEC
jgi:hypothetical protein